MATIENLAKVLSAWNERIVMWSLRFDNPILTDELRRRLKREYWPAQWLALLLTEAIVFLFVAEPLALFGQTWWGLPVPPVIWRGWGIGVTAGVLVLTLLVMVLTMANMGNAFDRERSNGTLVFLFLTPLTENQIIGGKLWVHLVYSLMWLSTALPWLAIGVAVGFIGGDLQLPLPALLGFAVITCGVIFLACLQLFFAVRATRPTQGSQKAMLYFAGLEGVFWYALFVFTNVDSMRTAPFVIGAVAMAAHLLGARAAWNLALRSLRDKRYGDVGETGKVAA